MNKKIKVLQLCTIDVTAKFLLKPLFNKLIKGGFDVYLACSPGKYATELKNHGYKIIPIPIAREISIFDNLKSLWQIYQLIKKEKFDIVHVHTPVAAVVGRVAAKLAKTPIVIYTAHGFYFHENMPPLKKRLHVLVEKILGRYFTDMLFTQSREDMATTIKEKIISENKVVWISNGVDIEKFNIPPDQELKRSLRFNNTDKIIGFIGRLVKEKGVEELFLALKEILKTIPQTKLLIIGTSLESDRDKFNRKIIQKSKLNDKIIFTGLREDTPNLLSIIDVFVLPSYREGMPRSIIEAMASGKPVVATNIRGCREEVIDGITGFLVPIKNHHALAEAIVKILSDEILAKKMGEEGRRRAEELFDEKMVLEKELKIYKQLINEKIYSKNN